MRGDRCRTWAAGFTRVAVQGGVEVQGWAEAMAALPPPAAPHSWQLPRHPAADGPSKLPDT